MNNNNRQECTHSLTDYHALMVCTSEQCTKANKVGCIECFLRDHIHNDMVEFKRLQEFANRLGPLKQLAEERKELQTRIFSVYDQKMRKFEQSLKQQRSKLEAHLDTIIDEKLCEKVLAMNNRDISDTGFLREVFEEKFTLSSERFQIAKDVCQSLQSNITSWLEGTLTDGSRFIGQASNHKRDRPHQIQENDKKTFKKQNALQKTITVLVDDGLVHTNNSLSTPIRDKPSENETKSITTDRMVELNDFESAINFLEEVQYNRNIDVGVNEMHPTQNKSSNLTKFIHGLCRLEKVETLSLKIGNSTDLVASLLKKIDESVSCLPKLRQLSFEGWTSDIGCKFASLPETRRRLRNEKQISVVLHKLESVTIE